MRCQATLHADLIGFVADYPSTVSNYSHEYKHLNPPGFLVEDALKFCTFHREAYGFLPRGATSCISLNTASPASARTTRLFVPNLSQL